RELIRNQTACANLDLANAQHQFRRERARLLLLRGRGNAGDLLRGRRTTSPQKTHSNPLSRCKILADAKTQSCRGAQRTATASNCTLQSSMSACFCVFSASLCALRASVSRSSESGNGGEVEDAAHDVVAGYILGFGLVADDDTVAQHI